MGCACCSMPRWTPTPCPTVAELKWATGRNAGRFRFVEAEVALRVRELEKAETITRHIEERIRAEPMERTHLRYAVPLSDTAGTLSKHFGEAPYFALITLRLADEAVEEQQIVANPYGAMEKAKGIQVAEWLVAQKVDVVLMKESLRGKGPLYVFGEAGVEMRETEATTLAAALAEVRG